MAGSMAPRPRSAVQRAAPSELASPEPASRDARPGPRQRGGAAAQSRGAWAFLLPRAQDPAARREPAAMRGSGSPASSPRTSSQARRRPVELSSAQPSAQGTIIVRRATLHPDRETVVIDHARAVQVGDGNDMFTEYRFDMVRPEVDLAGLLDGNPRVRQALGRLVADPSSWSAGRAMQRALAGGSLWTGGVIQRAARAGPGVRRVPARGATGSPVVVTGSQAVQAGDHGTLRNLFGYTVREAKLDPAGALHGNPKLVRMLATAIAHPGAAAPRRAFTRALQRAHGDTAAMVEQARIHFDGFPVTGDAIQLGSRNRRADVARVVAGQFAVTGWESATPYAVECATPALDHALRDRQPFGSLAAAPPGLPRIAADGTLRLPAGPPSASRPVVTMRSATAHVWGSVDAIAQAIGTRSLDAGTLLRWVRKWVLADPRNRSLRSTAQALSTLRQLRDVVFVDPQAGVGFQVAIDPRSGAVRWTSVIAADLSGPHPTFTAYRAGPAPVTASTLPPTLSGLPPAPLRTRAERSPCW
jgi:hypothetical protein